MRKQVVILYAVLFVTAAAVFALSIIGCNDEDGSSALPTEPTTNYERDSHTSTPVDASPTVYITKTGAKYHRAGCRYLKSSAIPIAKSAAISQGYTACSVCKP